MKTLILSILFIVNFTVNAQNRKEINSINLTDDQMHYIAGNLISSGAGYSMYLLSNKPFLSCLTGFATGATVGVLKEVVYDKMMKRGTFDVNDMATTAWGALVGAVTLRVEINIEQVKNKTHFLFRKSEVKKVENLNVELYTFNN